MVTVHDWMGVTERDGERRRRTRLTLETTVRGRDGHFLGRCANQDVTVCRDWEGTTCGLLTQRTQGDKETKGIELSKLIHRQYAECIRTQGIDRD